MKILKFTKFYFSKTQQNYYKILRVTKSASFEQIRRQYLKLAKKYHPDLNHKEGSQDKFKQIQKAFETLSNKNFRKQYNQQLGILDEWDADIKELEFQNNEAYKKYENLYIQYQINKEEQQSDIYMDQQQIQINDHFNSQTLLSFIGYVMAFGFIGILNIIIQKTFIGSKYTSKQSIQRTKEDINAKKKGFVPRLMPL